MRHFKKSIVVVVIVMVHVCARGYQCYNLSQKISGFSDVLLPIYKCIKCVTQNQISHENKQN